MIKPLTLVWSVVPRSAGSLLSRLAVFTVLSLTLSACSTDDNPRLAMCQKMAGNLVGKISSWDNTDIKETNRQMTIKVAYTPQRGNAGTIDCVFERDRFNRDDTNAQFATAPTAVTLNGRKLGAGEILKAGLAASAEQLTEVAVETGKQSKELVDETTRKAEEITEQAEAALTEAERKAAELARKAADAAAKTAQDVQRTLQNQ